MSEPIYVAQVFDPALFLEPKSVQDWFSARNAEAFAAGATWARYHMEAASSGLLIEAWTTKPEDEGPARWSLCEDVSA